MDEGRHGARRGQERQTIHEGQKQESVEKMSTHRICPLAGRNSIASALEALRQRSSTRTWRAEIGSAEQLLASKRLEECEHAPD